MNRSKAPLGMWISIAEPDMLEPALADQPLGEILGQADAPGRNGAGVQGQG